MNTVFNLQTYPATRLEISHSTMGSYHSCPRKLEFSKLFEYNLRSESVPGNGGNAIHEAVGVYLMTEDREAAIWEYMSKYPIHLNTNPLHKWSLESGYAALCKIMNYLDHHTELELAFIEERPAIEVAFEINIIHNIPDLMPVVYRGYIDLVMFDRTQNKYKVIDLKNTTYDMEDFTPKWRWDSQCLPYGLILKAALGESIDHLDVEYLVTKVSLLESKIVPLEFHKSQQEIQEWSQDLMLDLTTISTYINSKWFPRRSSGCYNFGRTCQFYDLCETRNIQTMNLMLESKKPKYPKKDLNPWITLDLEIT